MAVRAILLLAAWLHTAAAVATSAAPLEQWVAEASRGLDARALLTLERIAGADRKLLAVRGYLRAGATLPERWSWSEEQLAAYPSSREGTAAAADLDRVIAAFAAANPGCTLYVNRKPRSLELQVAHWNVDPSVGTAAAALAAALELRFAQAPAAPGREELADALMQWTPSVPIGLAAPGLSAHGQGRAFDFQIERAGKIIAGVEMASAGRDWDAPGWTLKLRAAVSAAGGHFDGPLLLPYEPWHYAYSPASTD